MKRDSLRLSHWAFLAAIAFVVFEGLLRKLAPGANVAIAAFKFPLFFLLLGLFLLRWPIRRKWPIPTAFKFYLCYGAAVTAYAATVDYPDMRAIGVAVNLLFVPMALVGAELFSQPKPFAVLMRTLLVLAALSAAVAVVQSRLHYSHWLNAAAADEDRVAVTSHEGIRCDATFQHCTVYGMFTLVATIAACCVALYDHSDAWRIVAVPIGMATLVGGMFSGSRTAFFGSLLMGCILVGPVIAGRIRVRPLALAGQMLLVLGFLSVGYQALANMPEDETQFRATSTESFLSRVTGYYLTQGLENAYHEGGAVGDGWGPLTNGAASYAGFIGGREFRKFDNHGLVSNFQAHYVEGGYACTLYAVGWVGLALFLVGHASFIAPQLNWRWLSFGIALGAWSLLGNLPFSMQEVNVLAILWWTLAGVFWGRSLLPP